MILWTQYKTFYGTLSRKKTFAGNGEPGEGKLNRVLTVFDLTALGIGCTLGSGIYVLAGTVAKSVAGPAVVLSFAVAAIVSSFSGEHRSSTTTTVLLHPVRPADMNERDVAEQTRFSEGRVRFANAFGGVKPPSVASRIIYDVVSCCIVLNDLTSFR